MLLVIVYVGAPNKTGEEKRKHMARQGIEPEPIECQANDLPPGYRSQLVQKEHTSVVYT